MHVCYVIREVDRSYIYLISNILIEVSKESLDRSCTRDVRQNDLVGLSNELGDTPRVAAGIFIKFGYVI
jgi:hypothetical protein